MTAKTTPFLQEVWRFGGRGIRQKARYFNFDAMLARLKGGLAQSEPGKGVFSWEIPDEPAALRAAGHGHFLQSNST